MRSVLVSAAVLLIAGLRADPAGAEPKRAVPFGSASDVLAVAERAARQGNARIAEIALTALLADPSAEVRSEARFRLAKLLAANGKTTQAAVLLRRVVDDHPDAAPARLELASLLHRIGDEKSALRELRALSTLDLPLNVARFVDRLSASLQASKPLGFQIEVALAPDTNINRATRSDTLGTVFGDFTLDQKAKSGVGAAVRGFGQARLSLAPNLTLIARASGEANLYRDKDFNDINLDFAAGPEFRIGRTRLGAEAGIGQQWFEMKPYQRSLRLAGSATHPIDSVSQLRLDAGARWSDNKLNHLQDGRGLSLRGRYERALSPEMMVAVTVGADRFKARDDAYSTRSWNAGAVIYRDIGRMTLSAGVEVGRLKADERLSLLPEAREDKLLRLSVGSVFRQFAIAGFAPVTRLVFERNQSSVEFYDYKRTRTEFGISRAF